MSILPAATVQEGVLGLEAQHLWGGFALNVIDAGYPRFIIDKITGIHSLPDADDNREAKLAAIGERVYPGMPRGKTVVYEGRVQALDLISLRIAANSLKGAFGDRSNEGIMTVRPHPERGGVMHTYTARVLACDVDDEQTRDLTSVPSPWQRDFVLTLRQADPRYYDSVVQQVLGTADGIGMTILNNGNAPGDPYIVCHGPDSGDIYIDKIEVGGAVINRLRFSNIPLTSGLTMAVDFRERTALMSSGGDGTNYINDDDSTYWDGGIVGFSPLVETFIRVSGCPTYDVYWRHTSW